ncbi:GNAT family N-acetyltransferase [Janibacter sp. Soil728]|uniref:GNAT family N-acetyltransferase n=1 Tax=Janibacter sp. Soil728 TaxID=1736393 RepID=UPI0019102F0B|nr:GNAT family N-acetyltransferase [Janibacter sp. Soil728]
MDQRISFVTLAVADLDASRRFYLDGLGWHADLDVPGEVLMIRTGEQLVLSLWDATQFEGEVGPIRRGEGLAPITLAHNVAAPAEVDEILALARSAGSSEVASGQARDWGGYTGYFADPDGFRWEIAHNPGPIGQVVLPPSSRAEVRSNEHGQPIGPQIAGWTPPPHPTIEAITGAHCTLEPLTAAHTDELFAELGSIDHSLWTYLGEDPMTEAAPFAQYVAGRLDDDSVEVVIRDGDGVASGLVALMRIDTANGGVEIGNVLLGPRLQRTTAATEAMSLLAGHVFDLGYRRYEWKCDSLNAPSRRAAERLGFSYEGTFRRHRVTKGRSRDTSWFAMTLDDWPRVRAAHEAWLAEGNFVQGDQRRRLADLLAAG